MLIAAHGMQRGPDTPFATVVLVSAAAGLAAAALTAWTISHTLGSWRRAVTSMIAASGTALVGVLTTAADMVGGRLGLAALGALCIGTILLARRIFLAKDAG